MTYNETVRAAAKTKTELILSLMKIEYLLTYKNMSKQPMILITLKQRVIKRQRLLLTKVMALVSVWAIL